MWEIQAALPVFDMSVPWRLLVSVRWWTGWHIRHTTAHCSVETAAGAWWCVWPWQRPQLEEHEGHWLHCCYGQGRWWTQWNWPTLRISLLRIQHDISWWRITVQDLQLHPDRTPYSFPNRGSEHGLHHHQDDHGAVQVREFFYFSSSSSSSSSSLSPSSLRHDNMSISIIIIIIFTENVMGIAWKLSEIIKHLV